MQTKFADGKIDEIDRKLKFRPEVSSMDSEYDDASILQSKIRNNLQSNMKHANPFLRTNSSGIVQNKPELTAIDSHLRFAQQRQTSMNFTDHIRQELLPLRSHKVTLQSLNFNKNDNSMRGRQKSETELTTFDRSSSILEKQQGKLENGASARQSLNSSITLGMIRTFPKLHEQNYQ